MNHTLRRAAPEYQGRPRISTIGNPYGLRGVHYGTGRVIIGGTTAEGARIGSGGAQPIGNARRQSDIERQRLAEQAQLSSQAATPLPTITPDNLAARKKLFQDMTKTGFNNLTPAMRERALKLGISHAAFNDAAENIRVNEFYTPHPSSKKPGAVNPSASTAAPKPKPAAAPAATAPAAPATNLRQAMPDVGPGGIKLTPQIATNTPGEAPLVNGQRINRLTGKPMGWLPGDPSPPPPAAPAPPIAPAPPSYVPPALQSSFFPQTTPPPAPAPPVQTVGGVPVKTEGYGLKQAAPVTPTTPAAAATSKLRDLAPEPPIVTAGMPNPNTTPNSPVPTPRPSWSNATGVLPTAAASSVTTPTTLTPIGEPQSALKAAMPSMSPADAKGISNPNVTLKKSVESGLDAAGKAMAKQKPTGPAFGSQTPRVAKKKPLYDLGPNFEDSWAQKLGNALSY